MPPDWTELDSSVPNWWDRAHYDEDDTCPCPDHAAMRMDWRMVRLVIEERTEG